MRSVDESWLDWESGPIFFSVPQEFRDALAHPVRRQIVRVLTRKARGSSCAEVMRSSEIRHPISVVFYHAQVLVDAGAAEKSLDGDRGWPSIAPSQAMSGDSRIADLLKVTTKADRDLLRAAF
jgi:hypothetical protein